MGYFEEMKYLDGTPMSQEDVNSFYWLEAWIQICHEKRKEEQCQAPLQ